MHEKIVQLKMKTQDGKLKETDVLNTKGIFRLIESIPGPKAEAFKLRLAKIVSERIDEIFDPEIVINRVVDYYRKRGYSNKWIKEYFLSILHKSKEQLESKK